MIFSIISFKDQYFWINEVVQKTLAPIIKLARLDQRYPLASFL